MMYDADMEIIAAPVLLLALLAVFAADTTAKRREFLREQKRI
jgi:hypothetical protein